jgi:uncharacterized membrane protein
VSEPRIGSGLSARELAPWGVLAAMTMAYALTFSWLAVLRHQAFQSHAFDLGNMDQAVWATLHGMPLRFTDMQVGSSVLTNRLAIHVEPILVPLSLLYLVHSGAETLLVAQALVVATGAVPAYLLARGVLGYRWLALVFPAAYLLDPSLQNALLDDFHAVSMSAAFLLWAMYFLWADRIAGFLVCGVLAAATKEEVALLVGLFGLPLALRRRFLGASVLVGGALWFLAALLLVIPHFNPGGHSPYLERYAYLGHGVGGILTGMARHPGTVVQTLLSRPRLLYLNTLLDPLGFVPLLGLPVLLLAAPTLALNMLSADPTMYSGFYQYSAEIVPYLIAGAIVGVAAVSRAAAGATWRRALPVTVSSLTLAAAVAGCTLQGFTPLSAGYAVPSVGPHQRLEAQLTGLVPPGAVVAAADEIEPHLSDRRTVYLLPTVHPANGPPAQFIVLDASIPSLPVQPHTVHGVFRWAVHHGYAVRAAQDGIVLLQRGRGPHRLPSRFYSFIFSPGSRVTPIHWRAGSLTLAGVTVHPGYGWINSARPAIEVESSWRVTGPVPASATIEFAVSGVHGSNRSRPPPAAAYVGDTPTLDWLPISRWPRHRTVRVASLPLLPPVTRPGTVDVYLRVACAGGGAGGSACRRLPAPVRIATITVRAPG